MKALLARLSLGASLVAQDHARVAGPNSGVLYDGAARSARLILGVPGAAYVGDALLAGVDGAWASTNSRSILVSRGGSLSVVSLDGSARLLDENAGAIGAVAWSRNSGAVAVAGDGGVKAWRLTETGAEPVAFELAAMGRVRFLSVSESGDSLLAATETELYSIRSSGSRLAARAGRISGLALAGDTAYLADAARSEVLEIRDVFNTAQASLLAGEGLGVLEPVGIALSANRRGLVVANRGDKSLVAFTLATHERASRIELDFEPSRMDALNGTVFLLQDARRGEALQVADLSSDPAVYFIPAAETKE
ncbi:MAG: hypothetical protein FJW40_21095 [Acidobacteria bacterium]|nr:hypothetical protein [Acidobacteriota bacterium]